MITSCAHDWPSPEDELTCLDDAEVVLRCERSSAVSVRFAERHAATHPLDRRLMFAVIAQGPGLDARLTGVRSATATTWIEAGAARDSFAEDLHAFLTADGFPVDYHESDNVFD